MPHFTPKHEATLDERQVMAGRRGGPAEWPLTPIRQRILALLRESSEPIGAYALLDRLEGCLGRSVSPPTVYRALDYLQRVGLAARIESRKGWVACDAPDRDRDRAVLFWVCRSCGNVEQTPGHAARAELLVLAASRGFVARGWTLEVTGLCACCCSARDAEDT